MRVLSHAQSHAWAGHAWGDHGGWACAEWRMEPCADASCTGGNGGRACAEWWPDPRPTLLLIIDQELDGAENIVVEVCGGALADWPTLEAWREEYS